MKTQLSILLLIVASGIGCMTLKSSYSNTKISIFHQQPLYKVYKIDSIHNYYLIYAKREDTLYKIVSEKAPKINCKQIQINHQFPFILHGRIADRQASKFRLSPEASLLVNCFSYDDSTSICVERDTINDLYSAENITGLCFNKNFREKNER